MYPQGWGQRKSNWGWGLLAGLVVAPCLVCGFGFFACTSVMNSVMSLPVEERIPRKPDVTLHDPISFGENWIVTHFQYGTIDPTTTIVTRQWSGEGDLLIVAGEMGTTYTTTNPLPCYWKVVLWEKDYSVFMSEIWGQTDSLDLVYNHELNTFERNYR